MGISTIIVDDERLARRRIRSLLSNDPDFEIIGECSDGPSAVAALLASKTDLVFLDIQMPEMDGFEVLRNIPEDRRPLVVFVTAHDRYALKAFDTHALDYLLKPFKRERFFEALQRAKGELQRGREVYSEKISELLSHLEGPAKRLVVKSEGRIVVLRLDEIDWVEAAANYVRLHVGEKEHNVRDTMATLERRLPREKFVHIHRSLIVNADRIRELQAYDGSEYIVVLRSGKELPLGRSYRQHVQRFLQLAT